MLRLRLRLLDDLREQLLDRLIGDLRPRASDRTRPDEPGRRASKDLLRSVRARNGGRHLRREWPVRSM
jgi:hypothetical protein